MQSRKRAASSVMTARTQIIIKTFPKRGFRFVAEVVDEPIVNDLADPKQNLLSLPEKPSIAVLPFENLSDDPEQEYFSDGMAEDLITDISKISGLFVIARNSSFAFKGQTIDVKVIAEQLGVKHILEGSVRKMGPKLRVNAQLIDAASGGHIWAERYDGDMADIFEFQDNIREQIVSALQVSLTPTDKALTERKPTDSVEAYDLFLKGRANFYRYTPEHLLEAIKCLEEAIEIDPNFAAAYGYLSYCHFYGWAQMFGPVSMTLWTGPTNWLKGASRSMARPPSPLRVWLDSGVFAPLRSSDCEFGKSHRFGAQQRRGLCDVWPSFKLLGKPGKRAGDVGEGVQHRYICSADLGMFKWAFPICYCVNMTRR